MWWLNKIKTNRVNNFIYRIAITRLFRWSEIFSKFGEHRIWNTQNMIYSIFYFYLIFGKCKLSLWCYYENLITNITAKNYIYFTNCFI